MPFSRNRSSSVFAGASVYASSSQRRSVSQPWGHLAERPEAIDKGTMLVGGVTSKDIIRATEMAIALWEDHRHWPLPPDYADLNVSEKLVRIIEGYTKVVNEFVWRKN